MKTASYRFSRMATAVSALLLLGAGVVSPIAAKAADGPFPCSAFERNAYGGWRVLAPVTLDLGGSLYSPTVGTALPAGATNHGIEMIDILDQQCGNR
ncbi:MAG TPA: hypothetical protein VNV38_18575 [Stellaceae bacterium]|jgi:hypothetical protein|nr:hypothetical protein [Stellaceae bacterium]